MIGINVVIYSYKDKHVIETIENLLINSSGLYFIFVHWHDQNGVERSKLLDNLINKYDSCNGAYVHRDWDDNDGAVLYKNNRLNSIRSAKYFLFINPGTIMQKDWDKNLIDFVDNKNVVVSGNQKIQIKNKNLFFVDKVYTKNEGFTLTNYIDKNFIFGDVDLVKNNPLGHWQFPGWLKYYGEEEVSSLQFFIKDIKIYAADETILKINKYSTLDDFDYYVPFSKYHNYNQALQLFKKGYSDFTPTVDLKTIANFNNFHNFNFSNLSYLPFSTNDVEYKTRDSEYDKMDGSRFIKNIKKVD